MWANILVALSNAPCLYPLSLSLAKKDYLTACVLAFVSTASFTSHLVENHKHGMPGIDFSTTVSYYLNRMDVLGCAIVGARLAYLFYNRYGLNYGIMWDNKFAFFMYALPLVLMAISEYDKYNAKLKNMYIVTHSLWHISVFTVIGGFLKNFIY